MGKFANASRARANAQTRDGARVERNRCEHFGKDTHWYCMTHDHYSQYNIIKDGHVDGNKEGCVLTRYCEIHGTHQRPEPLENHPDMRGGKPDPVIERSP